MIGHPFACYDLSSQCNSPTPTRFFIISMRVNTSRPSAGSCSFSSFSSLPFPSYNSFVPWAFSSSWCLVFRWPSDGALFKFLQTAPLYTALRSNRPRSCGQWHECRLRDKHSSPETLRHSWDTPTVTNAETNLLKSYHEGRNISLSKSWKIRNSLSPVLFSISLSVF